jgi:pimeloyl-ACP methyl ester carboxylesterase
MKLTVQGRPAYAYTGGKPFDRERPCIVFVHGAMNDHGIYDLLARWCANHGFGVLAPDLPGHMRSEGPALKSVEAMADWILALLDAAGVRQAALAGFSLGSLVVLEAAARAPERATRLVMLGTSVPMPVPELLLDLAVRDTFAAIDRVVLYSHSTLAAKPSYPGPGFWLRGAARASMRMVLAHGGDPMLFHTDFAACNDYTRGLDAARAVRCQSHLILGANDQMALPKGARAVAELLRATVHTVPTGHWVMREDPDGALRALRQALA